MGALAMFSMFIIGQVAYSCIPALQPSSKPNSTEVLLKPSTEEPTTQKDTTKKPDVKNCVTVELNPGRPCVFPFTYQYKQHTECLPFGKKFWCALTPVYNKKEWGYCDQSLCPPTAVQATEEQVVNPGPTTTTATTTTSSTTPTTTTTTSTPAEAWEDGSTSIAIKTTETFACRVDFQYSLQQGVKIRDVSSVCSGSFNNDNHAVIYKLGNHKFSVNTAEGIELECEVGAVLLEDSMSLSEEVLISSLKCEAVEADCITMGGEVHPAQCVFPFNYNGRRYLGCTNRPGSTKLWCPTKTDDTGEAEDEHWGFCSQKCGYCGGSPITTRDGQDKSCGYDCLLRANKNMVGYDKAPLLKPTIEVSLPKESNYIAEIEKQHMLNIGPQSLSISCPDTKFYDPALQHETSITAKCSQKYRLTVTSESGKTLGENFKNDQFGCDPCPPSFSFVPGFATPADFTSNGIFFDIKTMLDCKTKCEESLLCQTFLYSPEATSCQLFKEIIAKTVLSRTADYVICAKKEDENLSTCGTDSTLDLSALRAELNPGYIFDQIENLAPDHQTEVYDIIIFNKNERPKKMQYPHIKDESGLFTLFMAPGKRQCNQQTFEDVKSEGYLYLPLFIGISGNLEEYIEKFIQQAPSFKKFYTNELPKLCGTKTIINYQIATSKHKELENLFSFFFNNEVRNFNPEKSKNCATPEDTMKTIQESGLVSNNANIEFKHESMIVFETQGFAKIPILRKSSLHSKTVSFLRIEIPGDENVCKPASSNDIFPITKLIFFNEGETEGEITMGINRDKVSEDTECIFVHIESLNPMASMIRPNKKKKKAIFMKNCDAVISEFVSHFKTLGQSFQDILMRPQCAEGCTKHSVIRIRKDTKGVWVFVIAVEKDGTVVCHHIQNDENLKKHKFELPGIKDKVNPHAELKAIRQFIDPNDNTKFRPLKHFIMDISFSPCGGCKHIILHFITQQIGMATNYDFHFELSFARIYDGESTSTKEVPGRNSPDYSSFIRHAKNIADLVHTCKELVQRSTFKFTFHRNLSERKDDDDKQRIVDIIFAIFEDPTKYADQKKFVEDSIVRVDKKFEELQDKLLAIQTQEDKDLVDDFSDQTDEPSKQQAILDKAKQETQNAKTEFKDYTMTQMKSLKDIEMQSTQNTCGG